MKRIIPGLYSFTGLVLGRVYAIEDADGLTLIDTSILHAPYQILRQLRAVGHEPSDIKRILVTHAHPDHIGGLWKLHALTGARVIASAIERPVIEGRSPIARRPLGSLSHAGRLLRPPRIVLRGTPVEQGVEDGDVLSDVMGGLIVVATPGHTPGHLSFWQPQKRLLFCGDVIAASLGLRLPSPTWTVDMAENRRSVARIAELDAQLVCFGHGDPLRRNAAETIRAFARKVALPGGK
ncbi:MAG TPA: MBL fold metallo-hydrolase [Chloroflexia bacterium]|jgi:glyoxylase-like metal-dependent hydrolase (beta-lactamase superfamily II)